VDSDNYWSFVGEVYKALYIVRIKEAGDGFTLSVHDVSVK
jgi:hypothetical protein